MTCPTILCFVFHVFYIATQLHSSSACSNPNPTLTLPGIIFRKWKTSTENAYHHRTIDEHGHPRGVPLPRFFHASKSSTAPAAERRSQIRRCHAWRRCGRQVAEGPEKASGHIWAWYFSGPKNVRFYYSSSISDLPLFYSTLALICEGPCSASRNTGGLRRAHCRLRRHYKEVQEGRLPGIRPLPTTCVL